jgi:hypothetical protein
MGMQPAETPPTRVELDQYVRELRRLSSARREPARLPSHAATRPGRRGMSRHELRILRRAEGEQQSRPFPGR